MSEWESGDVLVTSLSLRQDKLSEHYWSSVSEVLVYCGGEGIMEVLPAVACS